MMQEWCDLKISETVMEMLLVPKPVKNFLLRLSPLLPAASSLPDSETFLHRACFSILKEK